MDLIACEDTRQTRKLLDHYDIRSPPSATTSITKRSARRSWPRGCAPGAAIALVSDAGMPLVSDPGYRLVRAAIESGIPVEPVPGPSAALAALAASGLPTDSFRFAGFCRPSPDSAPRRWKRWRKNTATLIFYEAPHRILEALEAIETGAGAAARGGGARTDQDPRRVSARHGGRDSRATGASATR